jgi:tRNA modification GTPase
MSPAADTICALSTPEGHGALSVIRVSGPQAFGLCNRLFIPEGNTKSLVGRTYPAVVFGRVMDGPAVLDEAILTLFKSPRSFTGEDTAEFSLHGSPYIRKRVLELLVEAGARPATEGEFTKRAFLNGKLDLSRAEAVADLIHSESEAGHRVAMHQMRGGFAAELRELREKLIQFAALVELELDFGEEDVEFADRSLLKSQVLDALSHINRLTASFALGNVIKRGVPVAIIGEPNTGKSTLLNALLNEERAIVSDIAGTTRDTVEDEISIRGLLFRFIDTAGIRETVDTIESIGIDRALEKARQAETVLLLADASRWNPPQLKALADRIAHRALIVVVNKIDLLTAEQLQGIRQETAGLFPGIPSLYISASLKTDLEELKNTLFAHLDTSVLQPGGTVVTNLRHYEALKRAEEYLTKVLVDLDTAVSGDFLAMDIRQALFHLGEITGEVTTDDLLGNIFSRFCIGK